MLVDIASSSTLINLKTFKKLKNAVLVPSTKELKDYSGNIVEIEGEIEAYISKDANGRPVKAKCLVTKTGENIVGITELTNVKLFRDLARVLNSQHKTNEHGNCLKVAQNLETKEDFKTITIIPLSTAKPKKIQIRRTPFKFREKVKLELDRLIRDGVIEKCIHSDWASPIIVKKKKNSDRIRICEDFVYLNSQILGQKYPLPKIDDLFSRINPKAKYFATLDNADAFHNLVVSTESRNYLTIITEFGSF
eukprot:GAHX01002200.1.p2 GENE.GAHX01002200.1~~GAHX01002200.1.p2  ORF type:complete len:250 (-),score=49.81 GAHX01002200.1:2110-2859(-)